MNITVSITTSSGVFVLMGERQDGSADWRFLRRRDDGTVYAAPPPSRVLSRFRRHCKEIED